MGDLSDYNIIVSYGLIIAASVTVGTVQPVLTTNHMAREIIISNTLDKDSILTLNGASWIALPAGSGGGTTPFRVVIPAGTVLGVIPMSASPTAGTWLALTAN